MSAGMSDEDARQQTREELLREALEGRCSTTAQVLAHLERIRVEWEDRRRREAEGDRPDDVDPPHIVDGPP